MEGNLSCLATNCTHNFGCKCKAGGIHIGKDGCVTFQDRANGSFVNSVGDCFTTMVSGIRCESGGCVNNQGKACLSEDVDIGFGGSCCNKFQGR